jgi:uncharacterized repeat protein (TIGR03806 family)
MRLLLSLLAATAAAGVAPAQEWRDKMPDDPDVPPGFVDSPVADGFTNATAMTIAPDGRIFVCEQAGTLRVVKDGKLLPEPFLKLDVTAEWERGLIGVALHPKFPETSHVFVCYVTAKPFTHHVVSRFTADGDKAVPGSEKVLLAGDDQAKMGGPIPAGHQGGCLKFGTDGKLYIAVGEQTAGMPSQKLDTFLGKILRINEDGSIPEDNPFAKTAAGKYRAIWCLGLRNPYVFDFQAGTGRMFINDVGQSRLEEIDEGFPGANYGWPHSEGPTANKDHRGPVHAYSHNVGRCICGGAFYPQKGGSFPEKYAGKYFFSDFMDHWIRVLDPNKPDAEPELFATGLAAPVYLCVGPDGSLYYLNRREWVNDGKGKPATGSVRRIAFVPPDDRRYPRFGTMAPVEHTVVGQSQTLDGKATGEGSISYQWYRNGQPLRGETKSVLKLPAATSADDGAIYRVAATNVHGTAKSGKIRLRVHHPLKAVALANPTPTDAVADDTFVQITEGPAVVTFRTSGPGHLFVGGVEVVRGVGDHPNEAVVGLERGYHAIRFVGPKATKVSAPGPLVKAAVEPVKPPRPTPLVRVGDDPADLPKLLSQTGVFADVKTLAPAAGVLPFAVNSPLWSDGAEKQRWAVVPAGKTVGFSPTGGWRFPAGTVFVKHFSAGGTRLETRLLYVNDLGTGYGVTYRWRADQSDADLLANGLTADVQLADGTTKKWSFPSRADCLSCHTPNAFVLGANTRQLNRESQLEVWVSLGLFANPPKDFAALPRLAALNNAAASMELRARSYLDANCAACHRPDGARGMFDARFDTPPARQGLLDGEVAAADISGARRYVVPGRPEQSELVARMTRRGDVYQMPPLASHAMDRQAVEVLSAWIRAMPPGKRRHRPPRRGRVRRLRSSGRAGGRRASSYNGPGGDRTTCRASYRDPPGTPR